MKKTTFALLLALLLLSSCSERTKTPDNTDTPAATGSAAAGTAGSPEAMPPETEEAKFQWSSPSGGEEIEVISGAQNLDIRVLHTESDGHREFLYDDRYVLVLSWDAAEDKEGNRITDAEGSTISSNIRLRVLDVTRGECTDDIPFAGTDVPHSISYFDDGCWLYSSSAAWSLTLADGKIHIVPVRLVSVEDLGRQITSPDGTWTAFTEDSMLYSTEKSSRKLLLRPADGTITVVCEDRREGNAQTDRYYHPLGFLDDTHLAYSITGWESSVGWGIYDITTGNHITGEGTARAVYDGRIWLTEDSGYEPIAIRSVDMDGAVTTHAEKGKTELPLFSAASGYGYRMFTMKNGLWSGMPYDECGGVRTFIFDAQAQTLLGEIAHAPDGGGDFWYTDGKTLTFVRN